MAATFDPALPALRDHIRFAIADVHDNATDGAVADALVQDEVIDAKLTAFSYQEALAQILEYLIARYGTKPTEQSVDGVSGVSWGDRLESWKCLLKNARSGETLTPNDTQPRRRIAQGNLTADGGVTLISDLP